MNAPTIFDQPPSLEQRHAPTQLLVDLLAALAGCLRVLRRATAEAAGTHELGESDFLVLWFCQDQAAPWNQNDLARRVGVSPAQVSAIVESLRRRDLLSGERCQVDRRRQVWRATTTGQAVARQVAARLDALLPVAWQGASPQSVDVTVTLLTELRQSLALSAPPSRREAA